MRSKNRHYVMFHGGSIGHAARLYLGDTVPTEQLLSPPYADPAALAARPSCTSSAACRMCGSALYHHFLPKTRCPLSRN
ncbi:hypothetical protein [Cupriavidus sp. D39]|uniref:hypothetical protein n=1 Tax=Cupriavidus sp. D39 TaxID=2997877 RepID=UPI002270C296|nr:hypothetical protein [Cupriavidus sp. D39]MCY0854147.1 hypothetical protein [Cupriavidus sp. D39]